MSLPPDLRPTSWLGRLAHRLFPETVTGLVKRSVWESWSKLVQGKQPGYEAGQPQTVNPGAYVTGARESELPIEQIEHLRAQSWHLWRNNSDVRKLLRQLTSKIVGRQGLVPQSTAVRSDGTPHLEFRRRASQLWQRADACFDFRGIPGRGGRTLAGLQRVALREIVLSGEVLFQVSRIGKVKARGMDNPWQACLNLIGAERLNVVVPDADAAPGNGIYRGIELNADLDRVAYHLLQPAAPGYFGNTLSPVLESRRFPADEIYHAFIDEDTTQLRGVPWFASALIDATDAGDLNYNVLKAAMISACVVGSYSLSQGKKNLGLNPSSTSRLTDAAGNKIESIRPGMLIDTGNGGSFQLHNPQNPSTNIVDFLAVLKRRMANGAPGVKGSSVTGDYRNSTFSSERSADNDAWPELEEQQDWFAATFCQPVWSELLDAAVLAGWFDGVVTVDEYLAERWRFRGANWQGPVARSINPIDDANAGGRRVALGQSSVQAEARKNATDWRQNLQENEEFRQTALSMGLPDWYVAAVLCGDTIAQAVVAAESAQAQAAAAQVSSGNGKGTDASSKTASASKATGSGRSVLPVDADAARDPGRGVPLSGGGGRFRDAGSGVRLATGACGANGAFDVGRPVL